MKRRIAGPALNALLRASSAAFLIDVLRRPHDPRYEGKAIPIRNLIVFATLGHIFPVLYLLSRRSRGRAWPHWRRYPVWSDNLYLSIFWLDMAGNFFDLYDSYTHFDLIPHMHGSGALAAVCVDAFDMPPLKAFATANTIHGLLELQENLTDVFCGTHNVRGAWDTAGDLSAGLFGTILYTTLAWAWRVLGASSTVEQKKAARRP
jgi:hypothetical protein